jgi:hypothetical protein
MKIFAVLMTLMSISSTYSQSELDVYCYSDITGTGIYYNRTELDGDLKEYGIGNSLESKIKLVVIGDTCSLWDIESHSAGSNNNNSSNNFKFFTYLYSDTSQLLSLDSMINYGIPNDHVVLIYTPMSYDGPQLTSTCPSLAQTLSSNWGASAIQTEEMMILFGVQGYPNSFEMDTLLELDTVTNTNRIHFNTQVCLHSEQSVGQIEIEKEQVSIQVYPNPTSSEINIKIESDQLKILKIIDVQGRVIKSINVQSGHTEYQVDNLVPGNYYLTGYSEEVLPQVTHFIVF